MNEILPFVDNKANKLFVLPSSWTTKNMYMEESLLDLLKDFH
jgi:hypothetical protein